MKKIKLLIAALMLLVCSLAFAQNITVSGVVKDASTGETIPAAAVVVKGTTTGTQTQLDGSYSIAAPSNGTLVISCVGYKTVEVAVGAAAIHNISLEADSSFLDETIVVAYGTSTKATFTGSASVVKSEEIEKRQVSNVTQALSGSVAGVQTTSSNGQPGTGATIRIRGFGSINAGMTPLYVVDGVPYDGDIASINTQDIESISVLKDAAAAALYGARGANGVILIQTKKGSVGEAKITLDARVGVNSRGVKNYDVITSPAEYMETMYKSLYNSGVYGLGYGAANADTYANEKMVSSLGYQIYTLPEGQNLIVNGKLNPAASLGYSDGQFYYTPDDWAKETFSNQLRQEYNLSVSGGNDKLNYYFSAGYLADGGVIVGSGFDRISTLLKVDYQAKKWLKLGTNVSYSYTKSRYPDEQTTTNSSGNAFFIANNIAPVYPMYVRDASGKILYDGKNPLYDYGDGASTNGVRNWMSISNPIGDLTYQTLDYLADVLNSKVYAEITPVEGLKLSAIAGVLIDNTRMHFASSGKYGQSANYGGEAEQSLSRTFTFTQQYLANYKKTFATNHTIDALVGFESFTEEGEKMEAYGQNLYAPGVWAVNNTIDQRRGYGSVGYYAVMGLISRINYDYAEKYFVSGSFRRDASSRFAPKNRWGNFWSVSAAWNLGKEDFIKSADWIDMLKLKASFGQQGNDNIGNNYAYLDQYTMSGSDGVFSDGALAYKGNPELTWETTNAFNVGVDFGFFQDRLSGSIEYFSRQTENMLYYKPVAASNGYSSVPMNIGSMKNYGVEIDLSGNIVSTKNVQWNIFGNATFLKNKVVKLSPDLNGKLISGSRIYTEGESMYQLYLVKYAGVDASTGEALYWAKSYKNVDDGMGGTKQVVDEDSAEYPTTNYSVAQATNRQSTGDLLPKVSGGFGTSLSVYGVDLSVQFAYQLGGKIMDSGYQSLMHCGTTGDLGQNWHTDIANAWTPQNTNTDIPRLCTTDKYANSTSDRFLISSNYLSLNNITIGYTFPGKWTKKIGIEGIRIYGAADNIAVFSARNGFDPRQSFTSATTSLYTALRTISGGIKLTF